MDMAECLRQQDDKRVYSVSIMVKNSLCKGEAYKSCIKLSRGGYRIS